MKKDILTITSVALGTAALTVLAFWSAPIEAGNENGQAPKVAQPKLAANGIEMTLVAAEGKTFLAGDEPAFALTAVNTTAQPATATLLVMMDSTSPSDALSRRGPMPSMMWRKECTIALGPNEKKTVNLASQTKLPPNRLVSVSMQTVDPNKAAVVPAPKQTVQQALTPMTPAQPRIMALHFSTAAPAAQPMLARAK